MKLASASKHLNPAILAALALSTRDEIPRDICQVMRLGARVEIAARSGEVHADGSLLAVSQNGYLHAKGRRAGSLPQCTLRGGAARPPVDTNHFITNLYARAVAAAAAKNLRGDVRAFRVHQRFRTRGVGYPDLDSAGI